MAQKPPAYETPLTKLLGIDYPLIQGGMIWCAGGDLAAAVSNAGGLGLIGAGSMKPDLLEHHIDKTQTLTDRPFGVNLPITYRHIPDCVALLVEKKVPVVVTSAGSPKKFTAYFHDAGIKVLHVTSTPELAVKCRDAGVDAVVVEGNDPAQRRQGQGRRGVPEGRDEITTLCLVPQTVDAVEIPVVAAGGIADGRAMAAALALGADGVQVGSRFAASAESSASDAYKRAVVDAGPNATRLLLKALMPTRMIVNDFARRVEEAESRGASAAELSDLLGRGRAERGIFDGDIAEGEIEVGQVAGLIDGVSGAGEIVYQMVDQCRAILPACPGRSRRTGGRSS